MMWKERRREGGERGRERTDLRDVSFFHNQLEKMKAITLMLLSVGGEE